MKKLMHKRFLFVVLVMGAILLSGCSQFTGLRKPLYDGQTVEANEEAMAVYHETSEIIGAEKDLYIRYPFSADLYQPSLAYPIEDPVLLEEGTYLIGEDLPAGRASLLGNESFFTSENVVIHVGNLIIRDAQGDIYFENLFHSDYGQSVAQLDLIAGHTIEIIGRDPEVTVFYTAEFPDDPYLLMDPPEVLVNLGRLETIQPVAIDANHQTVTLTAGIFEVGEHLQPGLYEMTSVLAPHATELYLFRESEDVRVFELLPHEADAEVENGVESVSRPVIELRVGDKIYPNLIYALALTRRNP